MRLNQEIQDHLLNIKELEENLNETKTNYDDTIKTIEAKNQSQAIEMITCREKCKNLKNEISDLKLKIESLTNMNEEFKDMISSIEENEKELRIQVR